MKIDHLNARLKMIFTEEQLSRIRLYTRLDGEVGKIIVNVHGLKCREAERFINNIISVARSSCTVEVIHGYLHGTSIKQMLRKNFLNPSIRAVVADRTNLGVTYLKTDCLFNIG